MTTYSLDITLKEQQSTFTKIITTLRKLQCDIKLLHLEKEDRTSESWINIEIDTNSSLSLLEKSLSRIEGVHEVCNTTQ